MSKPNYVQEIIDRLRQEGISEELAPYYALLVMAAGVLCSNADVHDAWAVYTNMHRPDHRSLVPFWQLSEEIQELNTKHAKIIRKVAREFSGRGGEA